MASISNSLLPTNSSILQLSSGCPLKPTVQCLGSVPSSSLSFSSRQVRQLQVSSSRRAFTLQARYSDEERHSNGSFFVGGFILGGLLVGTLGCVYAPQISRALAGADKKDLMRKLPKFIYDEEKALERTRKILTEKIDQLNSAIDDVSAQLRTEGAPDGVAVNSDELEAAV